jgi:glucose/arabinose dehydrogenase
MPRRRLLLALVIAGAIVVAGGGTGAALCKFKYQCGIGSLLHPSSSGFANDKALLERLQVEGKHAQLGTLAAGFTEHVLAKGFTLPTDFAFLSPTSILVGEKSGVIRIWSARTERSRIVLDLEPRLDTTLFRGLITVAVDPAYDRNHFIYALYVLKPQSTKHEATTVAQFTRYVLPPGGRAHDAHVLLGSVVVPTCSALPATRNCLPSDLDHDGAQVAFAPDQTMFLSTGDGGGHDERVEPSALEAQDVDSLSGKVLHIDRNGKGLPGNPYWNGDPNANRSKVWAIGLRNPFRLTLDPRTGVPIVGDVGVSREEEVDAVKARTNLGWPCWEGNLRALSYHRTQFCVRFYARPPANLVRPLLVIPHNGGSGSVTGGTFAPASFGAAFRGRYLYADWIHGWIGSVAIDAGDMRASAPRMLARHEPGPASLKTGPDGALYVLAFNAGEIRRISRAG